MDSFECIINQGCQIRIESIFAIPNMKCHYFMTLKVHLLFFRPFLAFQSLPTNKIWFHFFPIWLWPTIRSYFLISFPFSTSMTPNHYIATFIQVFNRSSHYEILFYIYSPFLWLQLEIHYTFQLTFNSQRILRVFSGLRGNDDSVVPVKQPIVRYVLLIYINLTCFFRV
jgi:hypothetical protein